jgi:hypothetical protein
MNRYDNIAEITIRFCLILRIWIAGGLILQLANGSKRHIYPKDMLSLLNIHNGKEAIAGTPAMQVAGKRVGQFGGCWQGWQDGRALEVTSNVRKSPKHPNSSEGFRNDAKQ